MNRTIEDIQKDIELLGIKGGYDIEQLLTPQDCRRLSYEIERLNNIINELEKYCIEEIEYYSKKIKSQYITDNTRGQYEGEKVCFEDILGRLQELKGDESNGR